MNIHSLVCTAAETKMKFLINFLCVTLLVAFGGENQNVCAGEKILVMAFFSTKSHKLTYMPLVEELGKRGHNVTVLTPIPATKVLKNVKEILTIDVLPLQHQLMPDAFKTKEQNQQINPFLHADWIQNLCRETYDLPQVRDLLNDSFDLIISQPIVNECSLGMVYKLKAPYIFWSVVSVPNLLAERIGAYFPLSFVSNVFLAMPSEMTFYERLYNFGFDIMIQSARSYYFVPKMEAVYREKLGDDIPSSDEICANVSLILSNGHFSLHSPKPFLPNIIDVGGLHSRPAKPLPKDLEDFISQGKDGFIYFSLGSIIKGRDMPDEKRKLFLNVFSKLKQQVLWKWETETMPDLPKNVKLSKWLPQQDILGHKDIKMFITHCGGGSTEEAIYHGVPLLGLPFFGDQPLNAKLAKKHGFIIDMEWSELSEEMLSSAIQELITNEKYRNNALKISSIYKDQPEDPMTRAVYWVEYVMRHKGAPHLMTPARKLNFFQYHSYDVILTYFALITVILYVIYKTLKFVMRMIFCRREQSTKHKRE